MDRQPRRLRPAISYAAALLGISLLAAITAGCSRARYRQRADQEVYGLIERGTRDPRWPLDNFTIRPDPRSRFFDPNPPDCPPMPPDDPTAHRLMRYVDGKRGWPWEATYGRTPYVENPTWKESLKSYLPIDEQGNVVLDRAAAVQVALMHSPQYQQALESLYLAALNVTFERFRFDAQFFGGNTTFFAADGPLGGTAGSSSQLSTSTPIQMRRLFATGGQLVVDVANSVVWQFSGADSYTAITPLNFSLVQPLLRGAGRAVALESLTDAERALLSEIRDMERFRREFYIQTVAGGGARASAFLGLLRDEVQIRNQERNVVSLKNSLRQVELTFERDPTGATQSDSVEATRQSLYDGQSRLVAQRANLETAVDLYKLRLGLPPDLPVLIRDPLLDRFNLIDPSLTALQDRVNALQKDLSERKDLTPTEEQVRTGPIRQECVSKLEMVQRDLEHMLEALPERRQSLRELAAREEFQEDGDVDPTLANVDELHKRVVEWHMDYYGVGDPYVAQLAGELLSTPEQQEWFKKKVTDRRAAGLQGVALDLRSTLAALAAFEKDPAAETARANARLQEGGEKEKAAPPEGGQTEAATLKPAKTATEVLAELVTRLSRQLVRLSIVQARARLDAITLMPLDLSSGEAFEIARANRRDWMNARADLVDAWRQVHLRADDLRSDLDVVFSGDLTNRGATFGANNTTGSVEARLEFDAPLTRLAERNAYRRALIAYQQARRNYYSFEDDINQSLRSLLRTIRLSQLDFEITRGSVRVAILRVDYARSQLEKPVTQTRGGIAGTRELLESLDRLLAAQNTFASAWTDYEVQRMQLDLDLGTMQLDERGMWIDPGPIKGGQLRQSEQSEGAPPSPETLPPVELAPPGGPGTLDGPPSIQGMPEAQDVDPSTRRVAFRQAELRTAPAFRP